MNKKSKYVFYIFLSLFALLLFENIYLAATKGMDDVMLEKKMTFVKLSALPDLAISTEASYIRHRTLSSVFSIYKDDGTLREYFPSTFAISHSHILNKQTIKIDNEK